ncbi:DUF1396 domain-containing protein [Streptomyces sp. NBC_00322]|uniref:DUF1396 domain-containing protein n=1 Tax=Streptomyces sp. NBC_00322 TaxID=2975712 RepID=UPI002E2830EC|nr:DUF1396 domain-containing protein [Streptomyces sp. NBC_00322]
MHPLYRKAAGGLLAGALLCGTAACSAGTTPKPDRPAAQKPLRVTLAAAVKRAADQNEKLTSLSYRMKGQVPGGGTIEGQAAMALKPLAMRMKMKQKSAGENAEVEIRLVGGVMYLNGGEKAAAELGGKTWLKFDLSGLRKGGQDPLAGLGGQADRNPTEDSSSLTAAKDLKKVGQETVDGVSTTHYAGTVPLDVMRASLKGEDAATRQRREKSLEKYEEMGVKALTMDMWIDGNDHTKQFRTRAAAEKGPLDLTITFLDYNKPVVVKAPPASATADLAEMFKGIESGQE